MTEAYAYPSTLVLPFISALLQRTLNCPTAAAHQQALHGFLDDLTPWLRPDDLPTLLGRPFTVFDHLAFTPNGVEGDEDVSVALSPAGEALFRAWLRQRGLDPAVCSSVCFRRACVNCASPEPTVFLIEGTHGLGGPMTIDTPLHAEHQLDQLAGQFAHWRQTRPRPFAPIPSALWDQAVALAAALPPARVAHHIRVRVADLTKQMVARQVAPLAGPAPTSLGFVEVPPAPARPQATPTMQLELSRADGTRLSIHGAASTVPLETVLRAFLEGR